ncbi:MAG: hypothetical protein H7X97_04285, partial [Opitutaceae bacterium]|nr:hypothetical protein [Verrucomicrobiales bacterium]
MSSTPASRLTRAMRWSGTVLLAVLLAAARAASPQSPLDLNNNGISDIWELMYTAQSSNPDLDSDGDGLTNQQESIAGTNPFDSRSVPRITSLTVTTNGVVAIMPGSLGKHYLLQGSEILCGSAATNWGAEASLVARTNTVVRLAGPADRATRFFRILVSDVDTDGDKLTDWEEYQLGLDPLSASSNGQLDATGKPLSDFTYAANWLKSVSLNGEPQTASAPGSGAGKGSLAIYPSSIPPGTGLTAEYFTNSSSLYTSNANFNSLNLFHTTNDSVVDFVWGPATTPNLSNGFYTVRWTGPVLPQYSEDYVFQARTDDGVKLWVNDQLLI